MARPGDAPRASRALDWEAAKARLARVAQGAAATPEATRRILEQRAAALARADAAAAPAVLVDLIELRVGAARYAIEAGQIDEVMRVAAVRALPGVRLPFVGLIVRRGTVFPLIDLRGLLGVTADDGRKFTHAALVERPDCALALGAHAVEGLARVDRATLTQAPPGVARHQAIVGLAPTGAALLDMASLMRDARLTINQQPPARGGSEGGIS